MEEESHPVTDADAANLLRLYRLTLYSFNDYTKEAALYQEQITSAKTKYKQEFYRKKFKKVAPKWQDEAKRLSALKQVMQSAGIEIPADDSIITPEEATSPEIITTTGE